MPQQPTLAKGIEVTDLSILIALAASGRITRRDWQVIDAVHVRGMTRRAAARTVGISHPEVIRRLSRIRRIAR